MILMHLIVQERDPAKNRQSDSVWGTSKSLSKIYEPSMKSNEIAEFVEEDEKIRFDYTYTIEPETLTKYTTPPIVVGQTFDLTEKEIGIVSEKFKEWRLFHYNKKTGYFYLTKKPISEELLSLGLQNEKVLAKHEASNDDIRVKVKIWENDIYTIFGKTKDGFICPLNFTRGTPIMYMTKNQSVLFDDIKLRYDANWVLVRIGCVTFSVGLYFANQFEIWGGHFTHYGIYRIGKRIGFLPIAFLFLLTGFWYDQQIKFYNNAVKKLESVGLRDSNLKESVIEAFLS